MKKKGRSDWSYRDCEKTRSWWIKEVMTITVELMVNMKYDKVNQVIRFLWSCGSRLQYHFVYSYLWLKYLYPCQCTHIHTCDCFPQYSLILTFKYLCSYEHFYCFNWLVLWSKFYGYREWNKKDPSNYQPSQPYCLPKSHALEYYFIYTHSDKNKNKLY